MYNQILDCEIEDVTTEPVTLSEAKNFCKIDIDTDDTLITALITAAREACEGYTGISFVQREITAIIDNSNGSAYLPYGPVGEITEVLDDDGVEVDYTTRGAKWVQIVEPCEILKISYTGGFVALPEILKTGLLNQIFYLYENRDKAENNFSPVAKMILKPYRRV